MIRTWLTRSKERTCNPAGRPSRDEKDTDLKNSRDDWEWYFYLVLYCITGHKLILHQKSARAISSPKRGDMRQKKKMARICVKFRLPFLSESSRKLFGREPLETQLLNPMALFLNLLAHFSRTWACFS